jgi:hypothetical protein
MTTPPFLGFFFSLPSPPTISATNVLRCRLHRRRESVPHVQGLFASKVGRRLLRIVRVFLIV